MSSLHRIAATLLTATVALVPALGHAQAPAAFPSKPVNIVVPYAAGGPVDNLARALATRLNKVWSQPVVILNRTGANEIIGAEYVAKSAPDGYTLFAATEASLTMNPHLYRKLPYNPQKDFAPISRLISVPMVFFVPQSSKAGTLQEFIAQARQAGKTKPLTYGSSGAGGIVHLPLAMFAKQEGLEMVHVPYKGAAPLIPEVIAGQIDAAVLGVSVIAQHIKSGKLKALAVSSETRSIALPDVPTFKEAGVRDIRAVFNIGLLAPAGTPAPLVEKIAADVRRVLLEPEFRKTQVDAFSYVAVASSPAEYRDFLARDYQVQGERVRTSGASLD